MKRLDKIVVKHMMDDDGNFEYLGEFSDSQEGEFSIEHSNDHRKYKYFNADNVENMEQAMENYERACSYGDSWHYIGIQVTAMISISDDGKLWATTEVSSGGLWGIESDSETEYFNEVARGEFAELSLDLEKLGIREEDIAKQWECHTIIED